MVDLAAESLSSIYLRSEHVPCPVANEHLIKLLGILLIQRNSLVVDLDFFGLVEIVVNDHFAAGADQRATQLHGCEPVSVNVRHLAAFKEERQVRDVFRS